MRGQLRALVGLRWQMVRDRRVRAGLLVLAAGLPVLLASAAVGGQVLSGQRLAFDLLLLAPSLFLGFALLAIVSPLGAGGGAELFPEEQLVAFPLRPRTTFTASLLVAPLNLAWTTQVIALIGVTGASAERSPLVLLSLVTAGAYVAMVTVLGQAVAWGVVGVRQTRGGRQVTWAMLAVLVVAAAVVVRAGWFVDILDSSPTSSVVIASRQVSQGHFTGWATVTTILLLAAVVFAVLGVRLCSWALRRPRGTAGGAVSRHRRRRKSPPTELRALLAVDRRSVWRSPALRRGALVLALLPGAVAASAAVNWQSLALLPGLVAAGAALLFGVNVFCLDAAGSIWLATQPHDPMSTAASKCLVTAETSVGAVVVALLIASLRAPGVPTLAALVALLGSLIACSLLVVATCLHLSVRYPHRADLRGTRDVPAPPGTMAVYSLRLATSTTLLGLAFVGAAASGVWQVGAALALASVAVSCLSLRRSFSAWEDSFVRFGVVSTVASG